MNWPLVPLGDVLTRNEDRITLAADQTYREVTVRLWGNGVTLRRLATGAEIASDSRFVVRRGQFIASRIDARNGAFGLIPAELDGAIVTGDFPTFNVNAERLVPEYLGWYCRTSGFVDLARAASEGTTNRVRLKEEKFLRTAIPLPPVEEQRRIVARVDAVASRATEAQRLATSARSEASFILPQAAEDCFATLERKYAIKRFADFKPHVTSGPRSWAARYVESGTRFYRAQDVLLEGRLATNGKVFIEPPDSNQGRGAKLHAGDLMLVITGATVGRVAEYSMGLEPGFVSQHVAICRLPASEVVPRFALWRLLSSTGQSDLTGQRYGQGKPGLNLSNIRNLSIPVPPLDEQRRIVAHLDALQAKLEAVRAEQRATAAELDALLPSVLNRAFAGQL